MKGEITLYDIAGYVTERMVWQMLSDLSTSTAAVGIEPGTVIVEAEHFSRKVGPVVESGQSGRARAFMPPESFGNSVASDAGKSYAWTLGALAFYAITGMDVFEGRGGETQKEETQIPRIGSLHASRELSELVYQCLSYSLVCRPGISDIQSRAAEVLSRPVIPRKKLSAQKGSNYVRSLVMFWPDEMTVLLWLTLLIVTPASLWAQSVSDFDGAVIPEEMGTLVSYCQDLRTPSNAAGVSKSLNRDPAWTMMDELPVDKKGECTTGDIVDGFGLNDIGFSILKRRGGVTNDGGRFRDGRDPRYRYSFIEITVKRNSEVNYVIDGREGEQVFAIIPYDKDALFEAGIVNGISGVINGVCYIHLKQKVKKTDSFTLTVKNRSGKNMSYVLINYNSRNRE